ncbi:DNA mismatch repair protein Mlh3 isoform X3 [Latimeria chalumnae]|uniref:DNA mismatch repair protein Mlh3 isoform X3 n=1 Tax=Latimeria chalumnae TaxID=7897 RepID=UPI00313F13D0
MIKCLSEEVQAKLRSGVAICSVAQCVGELLLNSLDARSTCVAVRVDMETCKIQVVDNGIGMSREDVEKVGTRYFTSKCSTIEDLENLKFYGFRGEAVSSIANMASVVEVSSKTNMSGCTHVKLFQNGKPLEVHEAEASRPSPGTTVTVCNLFYNLPVRRKCMDPVLEYEKVRKRMEAISLMHPSISFSMRNDASGLVVQLSKTKNIYSRFSQIYGLARSQKLKEIKHKHKEYEISGYISYEGHYNRNMQFLFVNSRLVLKTRLHKLIDFLLKKESTICKPKSSPKCKFSSPSRQRAGIELHGIYVINIKCHYSEYDVCIEPAKTLIEFRDWDTVLSCIEEGIKNFLTRENLIAELSSEDIKEFNEENDFFLSTGVAHSTHDGNSLQEDFRKACIDAIDAYEIKGLKSKPAIRITSDRTVDVLGSVNPEDLEVTDSRTLGSSSINLVNTGGTEVAKTASDDKNSPEPEEEIVHLSLHSLRHSEEKEKQSDEELNVPVLSSSIGKSEYHNEMTETVRNNENENCSKPRNTESIKDIQEQDDAFQMPFCTMMPRREVSQHREEVMIINKCNSSSAFTSEVNQPENEKSTTNMRDFEKIHPEVYLKHTTPGMCDGLRKDRVKNNSFVAKGGEAKSAGVKLASTGLITYVVQRTAVKEKEPNDDSKMFRRPGPVSATEIFRGGKNELKIPYDPSFRGTMKTFSEKHCAKPSIHEDWETTAVDSQLKTANVHDAGTMEDTYRSQQDVRSDCGESRKTLCLSENVKFCQHSSLLGCKKDVLSRSLICPKDRVHKKLSLSRTVGSLDMFRRTYGKEAEIGAFQKTDKDLTLRVLTLQTNSPVSTESCWDELSNKNDDHNSKGLYFNMHQKSQDSKGVNSVICCQTEDFKSCNKFSSVISPDPNRNVLLSGGDVSIENDSPITLSNYVQFKKPILSSIRSESSLASKLSRLKSDQKRDLNKDWIGSFEENVELGRQTKDNPSPAALPPNISGKDAQPNLGILNEMTDGAHQSPFTNGAMTDYHGNETETHEMEAVIIANPCNLTTQQSACSQTVSDLTDNTCSNLSFGEKQACSEVKNATPEGQEIESTVTDDAPHNDCSINKTAERTTIGTESESMTGRPKDSASDWLQYFDVCLGRMVYINKLTGISSYQAPVEEETRAVCTKDITTMAVNVISQSGFQYRCHPFRSDIVLPFLPRPREERDSSRQENRDNICGSGESVQSLFSEWENPVFARCPEISVDVSSDQAGGLAVKIHNILYPYRFTKEMISSMEVLQQVDNKFIACLISTEIQEDPNTDGNLLVLVDQHAAHERVRLEQLIADSYENSPRASGKKQLCSSLVSPPLEIEVTDEERRLLRSCCKSLEDLGLGLQFAEGEHPRVLVGRVPMCILEKEATEIRRGRQTVTKPIVEEFIQEQLEILQSTRGSHGTLPLTVLKVLASQACHGPGRIHFEFCRPQLSRQAMQMNKFCLFTVVSR